MYHDYLILGGAGLVGLQVCRHIVMSMQPRRIVVASLLLRYLSMKPRQLVRFFVQNLEILLHLFQNGEISLFPVHYPVYLEEI